MIDNRQNTTDKFVKLFDRHYARPAAVRVFFVRAHSWFKLENIRAGTYDVRCQDLDSGDISKSQPFELEETAQEIEKSDAKRYTHTEWSRMTITLYTVLNGNTRFDTIGPDDF